MTSSRTFDFRVSSDPSIGARNTVPRGNAFDVQFTPALEIPSSAQNVEVGVLRANVWNVSSNISAAIGNNIFEYWHQGIQYLITLDDGLYSLDQLESEILNIGSNQGLPNDFLVLDANSATQKAIITLTYPSTVLNNTKVVFSAASPYLVLGWELNDELYAPLTEPELLQNTAPNIAQFNVVNSYQILSSSLVGDGLGTNDVLQSVLTEVPISAPPGSQIVYAPQVPLYVNGSNLTSGSKSILGFRLTDEVGKDVDMSEYWSLIIRIRYNMPEM